MDVGINNVIYMEFHAGTKMASGTCGKTIVAGTTDRGSIVYRTIMLPVLLYVCENWSLTLRENCRLRLFENGAEENRWA
jgi:hypothetical protein